MVYKRFGYSSRASPNHNTNRFTSSYAARPSDRGHTRHRREGNQRSRLESRSIYINSILHRRPLDDYVIMNSLGTPARRTDNNRDHFKTNHRARETKLTIATKFIENPFAETVFTPGDTPLPQPGNEGDFIALVTSQPLLHVAPYLQDFDPDFRAERSTFTIQPTGAGLTVSRHLDSLQSPFQQDLFTWAMHFSDACTLCKWEGDAQVQVIRSILSPQLNAATAGYDTPGAILKHVFEIKYPRRDAQIYINMLEGIKQTDFQTISEYTKAIFDITNRLCLCSDLNRTFHNQKGQEAFYRGLSTDTKLEMIKLNLTSITEIFEHINRAEYTLTTQLSSLGSYSTSKPAYSYKSSHIEVAAPPQRNNYHRNETHRNTKMWCTHHCVATHNTADCRANQYANNKSSYSSPRDRNISHNNRKEQNNNSDQLHAIIEKRPQHDEVLITCHFDGVPLKALIDTGATSNFIETNAAEQLKKKVTSAETKTATSADQRELKIRGQIKDSFTMLNDTSTEYSTDFLVVDDLHYPLILGTRFLNENDAMLNFKEGTITIDGKVLNWKPSKQNTPESTLIRKTKVCTITHETPKEKVESLISTYKQNNPALGLIPFVSHQIILTNNAPIAKKPYPIPIPKITETKKELDRLMELGVIRASKSPYCSAAFPIYKKNGKIRIVIDYRELNKKTEPQNFPLPKIQDYMSQLTNSQFFSQIDLNMGYYQIPLATESIPYSSFALLNRQYEFLRMPFGLCNAPRTFQQNMLTIFDDCEYVKVYLDDILVHSPTMEEHYEHLHTVLDRLFQAGISINWEKTNILQKEVIYLGHVINKDGIRADISRVRSLQFPRPKTKKEIMKIVGTIQWFRPFIKDASKKLLFATAKLRKTQPRINWTDQDEQQLQVLMKDIRQHTLLSFPEWDRQFTLETDASECTIGAVLYQDTRLLGFYSYTLKAAEKNYTIPEKEFFAIYKALEHFKTLLFGSTIKVRCDSLNAISAKTKNKRIERWKILLQEQCLKYEHVQGKMNLIADHLSRINMVSNRGEFQKLFDNIKQWQIQFQDYGLEDIQVYSETGFIVTTFNEKKLIIIPRERTIEFLTEIHQLLNHPGKTATIASIKDIYMVYKMTQNIVKVISRCRKCQLHKADRNLIGKTSGYLYADDPNDKVCVDLFGPIKSHLFKTTFTEKKFSLLVMVDVKTRWVEVALLRNTDTSHVITAICTNWFRKHSKPKEFISDQGPQFISEEWLDFTTENQIKHTKTSGYNPTCNSPVERRNQEIAQVMEMNKGKEIKDVLHKVKIRLNYTANTRLGISPFEAQNLYSALDPLKTRCHEKLARATYLDRTLKEKELEKRNSKRKEHNYKTGDKIKLKNPLHEKLCDKFKGPYNITSVSADGNNIKINMGNKKKTCNIKRVFPWRD